MYLAIGFCTYLLVVMATTTGPVLGAEGPAGQPVPGPVLGAESFVYPCLSGSKPASGTVLGADESEDCPYCGGLVGGTGETSVLGFGPENGDVGDAAQKFEPHYTKTLEENLKAQITLNDFEVGFEQHTKTPGALVGNISFKEGILEFNTSLKVVGKPITTVLEMSDEVIVTYKYKIQKEVLKFQYLVEVPPEKMKGSFQADLRSVEMEATIAARKSSNGTCYFEGRSLNIIPDFKHYNVTFHTKTGFKKHDWTIKAEIIINTFIQKHMFQYNDQFLLVYNAIYSVNEKTVQQTIQSTKDFRLCEIIKKSPNLGAQEPPGQLPVIGIQGMAHHVGVPVIGFRRIDQPHFPSAVCGGFMPRSHIFPSEICSPFNKYQ